MKTYKKSSRCWAVLVACCLMCGVGFGGGMTCMSLFVAPLVGLLQAPVTAITLFFTIATLACIPAVVVGPRILEKNAGVVSGVCGLVMGLCFVAIAVAPSLPTLYAAAVVFGLAYPIGTTVTTPIILNKWFYKKQGMVVGVALGCIGVFAAILSPVLTAVIADAGWQAGMIVLGVLIMACVGGCGLFVIRLDPLALGLLPYGATVEDLASFAAGDGAQGQADALPGLGYKEFFKSPAAFLVCLAVVLAGLTACVNQQANAVAQFSGFDAVQAGFIVTCCSVGNILGSLLLGWIRDNSSGAFTGLAGGLIMVAGFAFIAGGLVTGNVMFMYVGGVLAGTGSCLGTMAAPLFTMDAAGPKDYGNILGTVSMCCAVGNAIAAPIVSAIFDATGSYLGAIGLLGVLAVVLVPCAFVGIKRQQKRWS